jgi:sigma-B regulation protein RsbU (phosphoserine phosphatase)
VASLTAVALDNVRLRRSELEKARLEYELELARGVQQGLLPRGDFASCDFLQARGVSLPCYEVGGDYFDLLRLDADRCLVAMADVSGKGPAAALQAARLQGIVHASSRHGSEVPALMQTINTCIRERAVPANFATAFVAILDAAGCLRFSNGGHLPPLWINAAGEVSQLTEGGLVLGFVENACFRQGERQLAAGDLLVLYTDGVTEAVNPQGEEFGVLRLMEWARLQSARDPERVEQSLIQTVTDFCGGRRQADDLTVLVVRYCGRKAP